ncbi:toxin-antitoxin system YwqK family antitoxin [Pontimicrobium sp. MEBiC06410]
MLLLSVQTIEPNNDIQKKIIRSGEFDIECYVSLKQISSLDKDKDYYWFKSGEVHSSRYDVGGYVLHKTYSKFYKSNQLAEKGEFVFGLKNGFWKTWYKNGQLKAVITWHKGEKNGDYITYDKAGNTIEKGRYRKNNKTGIWVNLQTKDTTIYKKGILHIKDETSKNSFFNRLFKKKNKESKKEGFFKRLFKKKKKPTQTKKENKQAENKKS